MPACWVFLLNGSFPMGTSNFVEDVSLSVKLERLKHHLLHPGAPTSINLARRNQSTPCSGNRWARNGLLWCRFPGGWNRKPRFVLWGFWGFAVRFYVNFFFDLWSKSWLNIDYYTWLQMIIDTLWCCLKFDPPSSWSTGEIVLSTCLPARMAHRWRTSACSRLRPCNLPWSTLWARIGDLGWMRKGDSDKRHTQAHRKVKHIWDVHVSLSLYIMDVLSSTDKIVKV